MHHLAVGLALAAAFGIMAIGAWYLAVPRAATRGFGLPLPEDGPNIDWWLRLKGVRDVTSGVLVLAIAAWGGWRPAGLVLLVETLIPAGDMLIVLSGRGSTRSALGIHGLTAALMLCAAVPLLSGAR